jgi:hypothetical protein
VRELRRRVADVPVLDRRPLLGRHVHPRLREICESAGVVGIAVRHHDVGDAVRIKPKLTKHGEG